MRKMKWAVIGAIFFSLCNGALAGEWTEERQIGDVQYAITTQTIYIRSAGGSWTSSGCYWATAQSGPSFPGVKELLAIVLAAKANGSALKFYGDCNIAQGYFTLHAVSYP